MIYLYSSTAFTSHAGDGTQVLTDEKKKADAYTTISKSHKVIGLGKDF